VGDAAADVWGVYVHVPWCRARCPYCAFAVTPQAGPVDGGPFTEHVLRHLAARRTAFEGAPATLFFGGGTPSRLPVVELARIVEAVAPRGEVSIEANPEDVDADWLTAVVRAGVTRISLGVQTFDAGRAKRLGRARSSAVAADVVRRVADAVPSFGVDLMFAVPGEGPDPLLRDLERALALGAPHVSLYGLTIEEGTRFGKAVARGALVPVDADAWRSTYDAAVALLRGAGVERYEVSNFARPGHECAHNLLYWSDAPYLGLGPSAHGYLPNGVRTVEVAALDAWLTTPDGSASAETPYPAERATELLVSALRSERGVDLSRLASRTGLTVDPRAVAGLVHVGLLRPASGVLRLTDEGFPVCDAVVGHLVSRLVRSTVQ
jgi:putative oxygen-independent coproporphyrinogen III oxidase